MTVYSLGDGGNFHEELQRVFTMLYVVDNSSPSSIGGGGTTRRQPLAPPFATSPPATTTPLLSTTQAATTPPVTTTKAPTTPPPTTTKAPTTPPPTTTKPSSIDMVVYDMYGPVYRTDGTWSYGVQIGVAPWGRHEAFPNRLPSYFDFYHGARAGMFGPPGHATSGWGQVRVRGSKLSSLFFSSAYLLFRFTDVHCSLLVFSFCTYSGATDFCWRARNFSL